MSLHSHCVEKIPHVECGSRNALQVFHDKENGFTGYCFACGTYVPSPYGDNPPEFKDKVRATKSVEEIEAEIAEINSLPTVAIDTRKLRKESLEYFGVKVAVSEVDGVTPVCRYFPVTLNGKLLGYKAKFIPEKRMWSVGSLKGDKDLVGWQQALATGGKRLFITEGEDDMVALYQALKDKQAGTKWEHINPAVVSLPNGSSSAKKDVARLLSEIRHNFKEVVLVFDNDEPGEKAEQEVMQLLPTAHTVSLPEKDANECIIQGKGVALANAVLFKTNVPKNTRVVSASAIYEEARKQANYGLSYPWEGVTKLTRGQRFGETYYLGSGVKMGKSTLRSALASHLITEHGLKVFMAAPEESNKKTVQLMASQVAGKIFHDPDMPFDYEAFDRATDVLGDDLYLLNLYQHIGWDSLRSDIMVAVQEGCKAIFIDPITNLTNGVPSGEANTALQEIAQELAAIALDEELIIWIFCHLKAPEGGNPHERGGRVLSHQFAGSRAMMRSCHMMVGFEGNKDADLVVEERNQRRFVILEDREFGASDVVKLYYNPESGLYTEMKDYG